MLYYYRGKIKAGRAWTDETVPSPADSCIQKASKHWGRPEFRSLCISEAHANPDLLQCLEEYVSCTSSNCSWSSWFSFWSRRMDPRCAKLFCTSFIRYILHYYTTCTSSSRNRKFGEYDNIPSEKKVKERKSCASWRWCIGRRRIRSEPYVFTTDGEWDRSSLGSSRPLPSPGGARASPPRRRLIRDGVV